MSHVSHETSILTRGELKMHVMEIIHHFSKENIVRARCGPVQNDHCLVNEILECVCFYFNN